MPVIFSTHPLHPKAAAMLEAAGELRIASAPHGDAFLREGLAAEALIVRAPIPEQ